MKIIKHGNTYHEMECPKCKAYFGYVNNEIKTNDHETFENWSHKNYINCPECNELIILRLVINGETQTDILFS